MGISAACRNRCLTTSVVRAASAAPHTCFARGDRHLCRVGCLRPDRAPPMFRVLFSPSALRSSALPLLLAAEAGLKLFHKLSAGLRVGIRLYAGSATIRTHAERIAEAVAYRTRLSVTKPYFSGTVVSWGATLVWEWLITPTRVHAPLDDATIPSIGLFTKMPVMRLCERPCSGSASTISVRRCARSRTFRLIASAGQVVMLQIFCDEHYHARPTTIWCTATHEPKYVFPDNPSGGSDCVT